MFMLKELLLCKFQKLFFVLNLKLKKTKGKKQKKKNRRKFELGIKLK